MKKWNDLQDTLRTLPGAETPDAETFWAEFRRRAPARSPHPVRMVSPRPSWLRPALAWAAVLALLAGGGWWRFSAAKIRDPGSRIAQIQVHAPHEALIIVYDPEHRGTIVWFDVSGELSHPDQELKI